MVSALRHILVTAGAVRTVGSVTYEATFMLLFDTKASMYASMIL
jgi:hypothetical protein